MSIPSIAIFDIGKTNKKLFLFDEDYKIVFEKNECLTEIKDEDGDACEDLQNDTGLYFILSMKFFLKKSLISKPLIFLPTAPVLFTSIKMGNH